MKITSLLFLMLCVHAAYSAQPQIAPLKTSEDFVINQKLCFNDEYLPTKDGTTTYDKFKKTYGISIPEVLQGKKDFSSTDYTANDIVTFYTGEKFTGGKLSSHLPHLRDGSQATDKTATLLTLLGFGGRNFDYKTVETKKDKLLKEEELPTFKTRIVESNGKKTIVIRFCNPKGGLEDIANYYSSVAEDTEYKYTRPFTETNTIYDRQLKFMHGFNPDGKYQRTDRKGNTQQKTIDSPFSFYDNLLGQNDGLSQNDELTQDDLNGSQIPLIRILGDFFFNKIKEKYKDQDVQFIFSGTRFGGALAQEVAYRFQKTKSLKGKVQVVTAQAMKYLSGKAAQTFNSAFEQKVIVNNANQDLKTSVPPVLSLRVETTGFDSTRYSFNPVKQYLLGYTQSKFEVLGKDEVLEVENNDSNIINCAIGKTRDFFTGYQINYWFKKAKFFGIDNAVCGKDKIEAKLKSLYSNPNTVFNPLLMKNTARKLMELSKFQTQESSNALATQAVGKYFLKISKGDQEYKNLLIVRQRMLNKFPDNFKGKTTETPEKIELDNGIFFIMPGFYYDEKNNVTVTVSHTAGDKELRKVISIDEQSIKKIGKLAAVFQNKVGTVHGDFHLNNIRVDDNKNYYFIDVETVAKTANQLNQHDVLKDVRDLIFKTFCHKYKKATYSPHVQADKKEMGDIVRLIATEFLDNLNFSDVSLLKKRIKDDLDKQNTWGQYIKNKLVFSNADHVLQELNEAVLNYQENKNNEHNKNIDQNPIPSSNNLKDNNNSQAPIVCNNYTFNYITNINKNKQSLTQSQINLITDMQRQNKKNED